MVNPKLTLKSPDEVKSKKKNPVRGRDLDDSAAIENFVEQVLEQEETETLLSEAERPVKREHKVSAEQAQADFYLALVDKIKHMDNGSRRRDENTPPVAGPDFGIYSQAYQNFAQNNVSKREGFELSVTVNNRYYDKLDDLLNKNSYGRNK